MERNQNPECMIILVKASSTETLRFEGQKSGILKGNLKCHRRGDLKWYVIRTDFVQQKSYFEKNIYSINEETCGFLEISSTFHHMPYRILFQSNPHLHNLFV